jgi:maleate isomerase
VKPVTVALIRRISTAEAGHARYEIRRTTTRRNVITVGVLTPHAAAGADSEFPRMAPAHVRTRVSRIRTPVSSTSDDGEPPTSPEGLRALATPAAINEAAALIPGSVEVLAVASTSWGYAIGYDAESALLERLRERWDVPACATSLSAVSALRSHHIERISLIHPPWFGHSLNQLGTAYFQSQGFEVVDAHSADLPHDPDQIEPAMVVEWVSQHMSHRAEAVIIGGHGFRAARAIHKLEERVGRLVLEANQVLLWSILGSAGVSVDIHGFGVLFDDMVVGQARQPDSADFTQRSDHERRTRSTATSAAPPRASTSSAAVQRTPPLAPPTHTDQPHLRRTT